MKEKPEWRKNTGPTASQVINLVPQSPARYTKLANRHRAVLAQSVSWKWECSTQASQEICWSKNRNAVSSQALEMSFIARDQCLRSRGDGHLNEGKIRGIRKWVRLKCSGIDAHPGDFKIIQQRLDLLGLEPESGSAQHVGILIQDSIIKGHLDRIRENEIKDAPRWPMWCDQP